MSQKREIGRDIYERVKALSRIVDEVLFEVFPKLSNKYKVDGSDNEKPLAFALIDNRLGKLDLIKMMRENAEQQSLRPPYPGLWRLHNCEQAQMLAKIAKVGTYIGATG